MPNLAVNVSKNVEDLTYNPRQPGKTNLAYGAYENPKTFSAMTSDGDFAGEVGADYNGKIRIIDPMNGEPLFEGSGNQAVGAAFTAVNEIAKEKGRNASWAVQIDDGNGGWATAASDFVDAKKSSPLAMLADIALPIIGTILFPFAAPVWAAAHAMGAAAIGAALGSMTSSVAQGRSVEDAMKRALIAGATAGVANGVSTAVVNSAVNSATTALGAEAAKAAANGTMTVAKAIQSGATAAQLTGAGISSAAVQTAANTLAAAGEVAGLTVTGAGAAANALAGGANLAVNVGGNLAANTLTGGTGGDNIARNPADDKGTGTLKDGKLQDYNYQDSVNVQGELDNVTVLANDLAKQGATLGEMVGKYGIPLVIATGAIGAFGGGGTVAGEAVAPVETIGSEATTASGGTVGGVTPVSGAIVPTGGVGMVTTEAMLAGAQAAFASGTIADWIAAHPAWAAQLGLSALGVVTGSGVDGNGLATGGGTPSPLQQSALFKKALPAPSGIFANLTPRDVSKSVTDWNNYGAGPEQSFFNSVPVRASGVTPDPKLVVTPSNPTTPTGPTSPTTGTGTTATGTTGTGQTPTNLAVQNMTKYGQTPGVLDLRNQPTSVDNPYAGYATTRTPPAGAVALPANSNARFVVQEPMTAEELAKQARMSAMTVGMGTTKPGTPDLAVKTTGTPPQPANPASASATAPTGRPTDAYSAADLERIRVTMGPDTVASMRNINDLMAKKAAAEAAAKPTTDGTMNQFQLDFAGLKEQPKAAPLGVDPLGYYYASNAGMTNAERAKYNADLDRSTILNNEPRMSLIDSPEWLNENFGVKLPTQKAQPALPAVQTATAPTAEQLAALDIIQRPGNGKTVDPNKAMWDAISDPSPRANPNPSNLSVQDAMREANAINAKQTDRVVDVNHQPTPTTVEAVKLPASTLAVDVQPQPNYALNVPDDIMKQLESYNFQFKHGGTTSRAFAVNGAGDGREDKIDAKLSDGEYVIDAETVALLGNGSSKAGAQQLDKFRVNIRKHKGQKLASGKFSANAKSPEAYMAGGRS